VFPGGLGEANWGGTAFDPQTGYVFVTTQDVGALGSMERAKDGSLAPFDKTTPGRATFDGRIGDSNRPCQKPPWGRMTAIDTKTGDVAWRIPLGITEQLPESKQRTGRPALPALLSPADGVLFVAATDDNRFRALDALAAKRGHAGPITYQGRNGKQYVAIVATDTLSVYALR